MPKLRQFTVSGTRERVVPSHARPTKPPAKEIARHKKAALGSGGGKLPPALRKELHREATARRVKRDPPDPRARPASTRAGKKKPDMARYAAAVEMRDRRPTRKSDTPETQPGARAVPATRRTSNEPKSGKHRPN